MDKNLNESPDGIKSKKFGRTLYDDSDAHTFGYYNGEFYIRKGSTHEKFLSKSGDDFTPNVSRSTVKYPGRLWSVRKIISLWKYPENNDDFKKLINDINKNSDLNVNEEWFIEIPTTGSWYHNTESELIKLRDYYQYDFDPDIRGFDDTKPHEMSDYEWSKRGGKRKTAYNTRYHLGRMGDIPAKWKFAKERGIAENSLSKIIDEEIAKLTEDPDTVDIENVWLNYRDFDSRPFVIYDMEVFVGKDSSELHDFIISRISKKTGKTRDELKKELKFSGRIWIENKVISFWDYPRTKEMFYEILSQLEKKLNTKIFNNNYQVEVYYYKKPTLIPIENYNGENFKPKRKPHNVSPLQWAQMGGLDTPAYNTQYHLGRMGDIPAKWKFAKERGIAENNLNEIIDDEINNLVDNFIYHGTGRGQALNIQKDGYMKTNITGEEQPSISFTNKLDYAKHYAKSKAGNKMVILRTKLDNRFKLSPRIKDNKGHEYITFENIPSSDLEISTSYGWQPLNNWDVIFDEPKK